MFSEGPCFLQFSVQWVTSKILHAVFMSGVHVYALLIMAFINIEETIYRSLQFEITNKKYAFVHT